MKGKGLLLLAAFGFAMLGLVAGAQADVADVIPMKTVKDGYEHTKGIVDFSHLKHSTDYGAACGDCHHDDKGKPLDEAALSKSGVKVKCIECHSKPGEMDKEEKKALKGASKEDKKAKELEYHAEAVHMNCIDCHKAYNKEKNTKAAPTTCTKCHPKTE